MAKRLRVMLVDDHQVVRTGLRSLFEAAGDFEIVGEAGTAAEAVAQAIATKPDVVIMDVRLEDGGSGIEATREIRARLPETRVVMLTSYADEEALFSSIMAGADGYVLKQVRGGELLASVRRVGAGESLINRAEGGGLMERLRNGHHFHGDDRLDRLTPQEDRILKLVAEGRTNREIGLQLGLAEKTVKNYVSSILSKLEVARRSEAASYLARHAS